MRSSKLPDECVAFEVTGPWWYRGAIVELVGFDKSCWPLRCRWICSGAETCFQPNELRPLTPSARAALKLVRK
jgi:hypothetical protein